jgi:hypothetical protein
VSILFTPENDECLKWVEKMISREAGKNRKIEWGKREDREKTEMCNKKTKLKFESACLLL